MIDYWVMVRDDIAARARCGAAPAPGPLPAGTDIREAAEFKWIEAEVRRMDANGPAAVDWSNVSTLSLNILAKQSKDILVACWATYGLFRVDGYEGLAVGLGVLCGMVEVHWEGLFPPLKQEGARVEALDWLISRLRPAVAGIVPAPADSLAVVAAYDSLDDLAHQLSGKLAKGFDVRCNRTTNKPPASWLPRASMRLKRSVLPSKRQPFRHNIYRPG